MATDAPPRDQDEDEDELADPEPEAAAAAAAAAAALDRARGTTSGETGGPGFDRISMNATLQDAKVSAASNGDNYDVKFEIGVDGYVALAQAAARGKGSFSVDWAKFLVGNGGEVRRMGASRDADGAMHFYVNVHFPQSEISRSLGRIGTMLRQAAKLVLDPEQGELGLADGTKVDLTRKA